MSLKSLVSHSAMYSVAGLLQQGLSVLVIPIYARCLTTAEFGALDIVYQSIFLLLLIASLGMPEGLVRGYYLDNPSDEGRRKMVGVLVATLLPIVIGIVAALLLFPGSFALWLFKDRGADEVIWVQLSAAFFLFLALQQLPLQLMRTKQEVKGYTVWSFLSFVIVTSFGLVFVLVLDWGLTGLLAASIIGLGATGLVLFPKMLKEATLNFEFKRLKPLAVFGLAMFPALLARKVLEISDRYFIVQCCSLEELGIYNMGAKVANMLEVALLVPFLKSWQPYFYSQSENPDAKKNFARVTLYMTMLLCCVFLGMQVFSGPIVRILGGQKYSGAESVVTLLVLAIVFNGIQYTISPGVHLRKKLGQEACFMLGAAGVNLVLNTLLIPGYGRNGAALATAVSYGCYFVGTFWLSQKYYPIAYAWGRLAKIAGLTIVAYLAIEYVDHLAAKCGIIAAYILVGPILDVAMHENITDGIEVVRARVVSLVQRRTT